MNRYRKSVNQQRSIGFKEVGGNAFSRIKSLLSEIEENEVIEQATPVLKGRGLV